MVFEFSYTTLLPILFTTGLVAGTIDAIAGGGGLITIPILLGVGVPPHLALGTNKLQSSFGTAMAVHSYYRHGLLHKNELITGLIYSFIGAVFGAIASQLISSDILKKAIPILLCLVLAYTIFSPKLGHEAQPAKLSENKFYLIFGLLLGFYDGFLGPGVGAFWVFVLIHFLGFHLIKATACTKVFNLNTNLVAMVCFAIGGNIDYRIGLCMAVGQIIGGRLGAHLAIRKGVKLIRPVFILMVSVTIGVLMYKNYF